MDDLGVTDSYRQPLVQTASGALKAPDNMIKTPIAARAIFFRYRADALKRIQLAAEIEGMASGNPPYNPATLEKDGLGHITNVNNFDAGSTLAKEDQGYWNLINGTDYLVSFKIKDPDKSAVAEWERILAEEFTRVLLSWEDFKTQINCLTTQLTKFGLSPCFWDDEYDWRFRTVEYQRFFVPDQASTNLSLLTNFCIVSDFSVQYLWECYQHKKESPDDSLWDAAELEYVLYNRANVYAKNWGLGEIPTFMDLQVRLQNGDYQWTPILTDTIPLVSLFQQEYDGKFSHMIFDQFLDKANNFLYKADRSIERVSDSLVIFTSSPGAFTLHSNRGLGMKIFAPMQAIMRLDCTLFDMAMLSATPLIKTIPGGPQSFDTIRVIPGVPTNIGSSELQQNNLGSNMPGVVQTAEYLQAKVQRNMANSGEDPQFPDADQGGKTDEQAREMSVSKSAMLKNVVAQFYDSMTIVYRNVLMRMLRSKDPYDGYDYAKEFKEACLERGVPERIFSLKKLTPWGTPRQLEIKAARRAGDGTDAGVIRGLNSLAQDVPAFSAKGQKTYVKMKVQAHMGSDYVDAFTADLQPDEVSGGASIAAQENNGFRQGFGAIFSVENEQEEHVNVHLALGMETVRNTLQKKMGVQEASKIYEALIPHLAEHIGYLQQIPYKQPYVLSIKRQWEELRKQAILNKQNAMKELQAQIAKQQQLQEKEAEAMSDIERKNMVAIADIKRDDIKANAKIEQSKEANQTRGEIMREQTRAKAENERLKTQLTAEAKKPSIPDLQSELVDLAGDTMSPTDIEGIQ